MTLWQRLKNLWKLSEWEPMDYPSPQLEPHTIVSPIIKKPWFAKSEQGELLQPDGSDRWDKAESLKDLLGE